MKNIVLLLTVMLMFVSSSEASAFKKKHKHNIKALSVTKFEVSDSNFQNTRVVDLSGKDFFVVSVREPGSDGQVYAVDRDGTIWWHGLISSGAAGGHETTNGMHKVLLKRRFHMSKTHPNKNGIDNMDFEVEFTSDGEALHLGNTAAMSHGCVHVGRQDISSLFKWARVGMPVVVMRGPYKQFLKQEVEQFKEDLKEYDAATGSHEEKY